MSKQAPSDEGQVPNTPDNSDQGQVPDENKSDFKSKIEALKDLDSAKELFSSMLDALDSSRGDAAGKRVENKELKAQLKQFQDQQKEAERAKLSEIERVKAEKGDLETRLQELEQRASVSEAKAAFVQLGAQDIDSVLLHWQALSAEEKAKTTPVKWAETLKNEKPHLFQSTTPVHTGPNPKGDSLGGGKRSPGFKTNPITRSDRQAVFQEFRDRFGG